VFTLARPLKALSLVHSVSQLTLSRRFVPQDKIHIGCAG